ncbi:MAG: MFS transporter [Acidobacteria bacterium]|nr:MFS transporter [Acidobacteriota bacterium]
MTSHSSASPTAKKSLWILLSVVVIDLIGFGIVIPILPFYAEAYGATAFQLGLLVTSFAGMQFLMAPVWGRISDRMGRRPVILVTIAGTSLALLIFGLADSLLWLFVGRILGGVFGANISVATAYITDLTGEEDRTRWMGMIGASFGVGFILGPAIGGLLSPYGYHVPILLAAGMAAVNFLYAAANLREPERREAVTVGIISATRSYALSRFVRRMTVLYFLFTFGVSQLETMFGFFMLKRFGYEAWDLAWLLVVMAVVMAGIQGGAIRSLSRRFGEYRLLMTGSAVLAVACAAIPFMPTVAVLLIPLVFSSVGRGIAQPSMLSLVSSATTEKNRGTVMGGFQSGASLARVLGPMAAGALFEVEAWGPFVTAGVMMLLVLSVAAGLDLASIKADPTPAPEAQPG